MELDMRKIGKAYYQRSNNKEKELVRDFFSKLDTDGDGKVSLADFKKAIPTQPISEDAFFRSLDVNEDGFLDFFESLPLYYLDKMSTATSCDGCSTYMYGVYFSCKQCLGNGKATFDLCCDCYSKGIEHHHSTKDMLDCHLLVDLLKARTFEYEKSPWRREMEQLRKVAMAYFEAAYPDFQAKTRKFYRSMDSDASDGVDLHEYHTFMMQEGYPETLRSSKFFRELSQDGNALTFDDVITLHYIIESGRPICNDCGHLIPGIFFSCVKCLATTPKSAFNLCVHCYQKEQRCSHSHGGEEAQLLDNYTLLKTKIQTSTTPTPSLYIIEATQNLRRYWFQYGDLLTKGIIMGLLGFIFWYLMLPLIWVFIFMIVALVRKVVNKLFSDSFEELAMRSAIFVFKSIFSYVSQRMQGKQN